VDKAFDFIERLSIFIDMKRSTFLVISAAIAFLFGAMMLLAG
jgi:hypothetical protein